MEIKRLSFIYLDEWLDLWYKTETLGLRGDETGTSWSDGSYDDECETHLLEPKT
jgi:hypothetical protein